MYMYKYIYIGDNNICLGLEMIDTTYSESEIWLWPWWLCILGVLLRKFKGRELSLNQGIVINIQSTTQEIKASQGKTWEIFLLDSFKATF